MFRGPPASLWNLPGPPYHCRASVRAATRQTKDQVPQVTPRVPSSSQAQVMRSEDLEGLDHAQNLVQRGLQKHEGALVRKVKNRQATRQQPTHFALQSSPEPLPCCNAHDGQHDFALLWMSQARRRESCSGLSNMFTKFAPILFIDVRLHPSFEVIEPCGLVLQTLVEECCRVSLQSAEHPRGQHLPHLGLFLNNLTHVRNLGRLSCVRSALR
mmetsp:Transcript_45105/g.144460  ORF Transcript_45105/g.144460 Transcript_45105/m.144460 type:complete len:213 (+) Transcript_45105:422-1060(+)|eukprot:CAMPEP_0204161496 /NCGR_PEP_ID=MMETSP0361-20130328/34780_1 /ASSEMBLY_ACC=CAM_ASM_000343 /TAXON_ID=268821 /ORGANISM="Scrippsiella Hangoei, Strain SHTV-5" /LENGTH=212 /DNA_ID=CAMNT_0051117943 /DNA_START=313 /DNA_END=951 /DNA_ORIENTATION=+